MTYRERLSANADDFDKIITEVLIEIECLHDVIRELAELSCKEMPHLYKLSQMCMRIQKELDILDKKA